MKKPFCPILLIGFPAPEESKRDLRRCTEECAWYDSVNKNCAVTTAADLLSSVSSNLAELTYYYGYDEPDKESYEFDPNAEPI